MKRKVFSNGPSLVVTLPSSWVREYGIEQGHEVNISQEGNELKLFLDSGKKLSSAVINTDGFDKTFLKCAIRNAYKKGYDEILVRYLNPNLKHHRLDKIVHVNDVVNEEVNSLIGFEVVEHSTNCVKIKGFLNENKDDFDNFLRKIFLNLNEYVKNLKNLSYSENNSWEQKHWDIKKFISYCIRIINKKGVSSNANGHFSLIYGLDLILGIVQYTGRYVISEKLDFGDETLRVLSEIENMFERYYDLFYKYSNDKVVEFGIRKFRIREDMNSLNVSSKELIFLDRIYQIVEVLYRLTETRMELE